MMLRALLSALRRRRPVDSTPIWPSPAADLSEFIDRVEAFSQIAAPLPHRTPGLDSARRHALDGAQRGRAALRDVDLYADASQDPARAEEAHVRHVAALHQLDDALAELAAARRSLENLR